MSKPKHRKCPHCDGDGSIWVDGGYDDERITMTCSVCEGTGRVPVKQAAGKAWKESK